MPPSDLDILAALRHDKELDTADTLSQRFRHMRRAGAAATLDRGLMDCRARRMPELVPCATRWPREPLAVSAASESPDRNGQVAGPITTLTRLKPQSDGHAQRAGLRQRRLHAA